MSDLHGAFVVDKPQGISSFEVLRQIKRAFHTGKMGYLGTLDPLATGVLVVFVGKATQLIPYFEKTQKQYCVGFELGKKSDSFDITGKVEQVSTDLPSRSALEDVLSTFIGPQWQIQPAFSALKIQGKRSYEHARAGKILDLGKRQVEVHQLELIDYQTPHVELLVDCSSGTYVRSLVHELGQQLSCGAVMSSLRRTGVGKFLIDDAHSPEELNDKGLISVEVLIDDYVDWKGYSAGEPDYLKKRLS